MPELNQRNEALLNNDGRTTGPVARKRVLA